MKDPFRILGVAPTARHRAIRAAYLALMKRYHPDRNRSAEAAERAREVAAAYALVREHGARERFGREPRRRGPVSRPPAVTGTRVRGRIGGLLLLAVSGVLIGYALEAEQAGPAGGAVAVLSPVPSANPPRPCAGAPPSFQAPAPSVSDRSCR